MSTQQHEADPFASGDKLPSVSWRVDGVDVPPGTTQHLEVTAAAKKVESRNFETGEIERWPAKPGQAVGDPKWSVVIEVIDRATGEARALWCGLGSAMFAALKTAQQAAGQQFAPGGVIAVTFTGYGVRKDGNTKMNPPKQYSATYAPPAPGAGADAFGAAEPAAQTVSAPGTVTYVSQQPAPGTATYAQPVQQPAAQPVQAAAQPAAQPAGSAYSAEQLAAFRSIVETQGGNADATLRAIGQDPAAVRVALGLPPY